MISTSVAHTHDIAGSIISALPQKTVIICLSGDLGSGKTTFAQGLLSACGALRPYTSPTFTIIKEYFLKQGFFDKIYHVDAYRINAQDMIELGWQDMIAEKKALIIVEWPEQIASIIPHDAWRIECTWVGESQRKYKIVNL